jgi:flavin-binding protein dodecin
MTESSYKIITAIGTSPDSWERAAQAAVEKVAKTIRDVRIAEIVELDLQIKKGKVIAYRAKVNLSFRVEKGDEKLFREEPHSWFLEKEHPSLDG